METINCFNDLWQFFYLFDGFDVFLSFCFFVFVSLSSLFDNDLTHSCCHDLMEALTSANSSLLELDLSLNDLGQEGALLLCQALTHPGCALKKLV